MASDLRTLSALIGRWKSADPQVYSTFIRLLEQYVFEVTLAVTEASSGEVLQAQGRAQQARKFLLLFTENLENDRTVT